MIVKNAEKKRDPKYDNFYKKRLRKEQNEDHLLKVNTENHLGNDENHREDQNEVMKTIKITNNSNDDQKESLNGSYVILNKETSFNHSSKKKSEDKFFITNFMDNNEAKKLPYSIKSNHLSTNKAIDFNYLITNNSVVNNSITQNNINNLETETGNLDKNKTNAISKFSSRKNLPFSKTFNFQQKVNKNQSIINNRFVSNKTEHINFLNSNLTNNNMNNNNIDYQNTSMSSNASVHLNRSTRYFQGFNNSNLRGRTHNENPIPFRVFPVNNLILNSNNSDRKNYRSIIKSNENSNNQDSNLKAKRANNINSTHKKSQYKISNKEREYMFRMKKLNEEISKITPLINDDQLEKITKKVDFSRGGKGKKMKSEFRACRFFQDKNYDRITSNFKKTSLDKLNAFYADKFNMNDNLNDNLNLKLNSQHRDCFSQDMDNYVNDNDNLFKNSS